MSIARRAPWLVPLWLLGCAPVNPHLERLDAKQGYRYELLTEPGPVENSEETFVVLTFSGGGTRAAAFAYGVLDQLRRTPLRDGRTLLDEVDVISSVSGGSFAAAYLGLFGKDGSSVTSRTLSSTGSWSEASSCACWLPGTGRASSGRTSAAQT